MIKLLMKLFIKKDCTDKRYACGLICSAAGIILNTVLFIIKFTAGYISSSAAIIADAFNNLSDSGSSVITLSGLRLSRIKPDKNHPFGHGRIEYISGLLVSILIILMGFELLTSSAEKIIKPVKPEITPVVFVILTVSLAVKIYMYLYNRKYGKIYSSAPMLATAADSLSDAVSTAVVLISSVISCCTHVNTDPWCGVAVSAFILYAGIKSSVETLSPLLGQPPGEEFVREVEKIVLSAKYITGIHDLIVHDYGPGRCMISLHAEVPGNENIFELHDSIDSAEREIYEKLGAEAVIHMDPVRTDDGYTDGLKAMTESVLSEIDPELSMHDFRVTVKDSQINLVFDVVVPAENKYTDEELKIIIDEKIKEKNKLYDTVINFDRNYVLL